MFPDCGRGIPLFRQGSRVGHSLSTDRRSSGEQRTPEAQGYRSRQQMRPEGTATDGRGETNQMRQEKGLLRVVEEGHCKGGGT